MSPFTPKIICFETGIHIRSVKRYLRARYPQHPPNCAFGFDEEEARVIISDLRERKEKQPLSPLLGLQKPIVPLIKHCPRSNRTDTLKKEREEGQLSQKQKGVLKSLERHLGIVSVACKAANVSRSQFYKWKATSPEFASQVEEISEMALDYVESKLFDLIKVGSSTAIIFYLKTKGRKRGYC